MNNFQPPPWATAPQAAPSPAPAAPMFPPQAPQYAPQAPQNYGPMPTAPQAPQYPPQGYGPPGAPPAGLAPQGLPTQDFDGIGDAKLFPKSQFFPVGTFDVVQVDEVKALRSTNPNSLGMPKVVIVATVLESSVTSLVGAQCAQTINLAKYGKPDLKAFICAGCGVDPGRADQVAALGQQFDTTYAAQIQAHNAANPNGPKADGWVFAAREICGPAQPLRGRKLKLVTYSKNTKPSAGKPQGGVFTVHGWTPITTA